MFPNKSISRRHILYKSGFGASVILASSGENSASAASFSSDDRRCATCDFWGGQRSLAANRRSVTTAAGATGVCKNPQSPLFNKQSRADQVFANGHRRWRELA
jgi:hypothetical protein